MARHVINAAESYKVLSKQIRSESADLLDHFLHAFRTIYTRENIQRSVNSWRDFKASMKHSIGLLIKDGDEEYAKKLTTELNQRSKIVEKTAKDIAKIVQLKLKDSDPVTKKKIKKDAGWFSTMDKLFTKLKTFIKKNYLYGLLIIMVIILLLVLMLMHKKSLSDAIVKSINDSIKHISDNIKKGNIVDLIVDILSAPFKVIYQIISKAEKRLLMVGSMAMILISAIVYKLVTKKGV